MVKNLHGLTLIFEQSEFLKKKITGEDFKDPKILFLFFDLPPNRVDNSVVTIMDFSKAENIYLNYHRYRKYLF